MTFPWPRAITTSVLTLTVFVGAAEGEDRLTVPETVGLVFASPEVKGGLWNFMSRGNPVARPVLYKVLKKAHLSRYHRNAILILGYIGAEDDVVALEKYVLEMRGQLTEEQKRAVRAAFDALGILARRRVKGATETLHRMMSLNYWAKVQFRWYSEDVSVAGGDGGALLTWVLWGYAKSERGDLEEKVERVLKAFSEDSVRDQLRFQIAPERMQQFAMNVRKWEQLELDPGLRASLVARWNGRTNDPDLPTDGGVDAAKAVSGTQAKSSNIKRSRPRNRPIVWEDITDASAVEAAFKEGYGAYDEIQTYIVKREFKKALELVMDNGNVVTERIQDAPLDEYIHDLGVERTILMTKAVSAAKPNEIVVRRNVSPADNADAEKVQRLQVTFRLPGTSDVGRKHFLKNRGERTIAKDGTLIVVMEKVDGKWYWEPFGW